MGRADLGRQHPRAVAAAPAVHAAQRRLLHDALPAAAGLAPTARRPAPRPGRRRGATRAGAVVHRDVHPHHHRGRDGPGRLAVRGRPAAGRRRLRHLLAELAQPGHGWTSPAGRSRSPRSSRWRWSGLLWGLAGSTWNRMESVEITQERPGYETEICTPLEDRAMWNGRATVRRLRAVHVATAVTLPGVFALATPGMADRVAAARPAARPAGGDAGPGGRPRGVEPAGRPPPTRPPTLSRSNGSAPASGATATTGCRGSRSCSPGRRWCAVCVGDTVEPVGTLPWLVDDRAGAVRRAGPGAAGPARDLRAPGGAGRRGAGRRAACGVPTRRTGRSTPGRRGAAWRCRPSRCWRGCSRAGSRPGWCCATAQTLGTPVARGQRSGEPYPLVVPTAYQWVAVAALALGVVAVLVGVVAWWRLRPVGRRWRRRWSRPTARAARANPERPRRDRAGVGPGDGVARRRSSGRWASCWCSRWSSWWRASWASCPTARAC